MKEKRGQVRERRKKNEERKRGKKKKRKKKKEQRQQEGRRDDLYLVKLETRRLGRGKNDKILPALWKACPGPRTRCPACVDREGRSETRSSD